MPERPKKIYQILSLWPRLLRIFCTYVREYLSVSDFRTLLELQEIAIPQNFAF